jgi:hypothetical protein
MSASFPSDTSVLPITNHSSLTCRIIKETDKAMLVDTEGAGQEWFPLSTISYISRGNEDSIDEFPDTIHAAD